MSELLLQIRLSDLRANLEDVRSIEEHLTKRHEEIEKLEEKLGSRQTGIGGDLIHIDRIVNNAYRSLPWDQSLDTIRKDLSTASEKITKVSDEFREVVNSFKALKAHWVQIDVDDRSNVSIQEISDEADRQIKAVESLEEDLELISNGKMAEPSTISLKHIWQEYSNITNQNYNELFTDYVDFLRGLAVRDSQLDKGISQMADRILSSKIVRDVSHSLVVPARREAMKMTISRILRLGFPSWNLWTLPLAAHEYGYIVSSVEFEDEIKGILSTNGFKTQNNEQYDRSVSHLQHFFADMFATRVMGPSFACTEILLRFDPTKAHAEDNKHPSTYKRAIVIFKTLNCMNQEAGIERPYQSIIEDLENAWDSSLQQSQSDDTLPQEEYEELMGWIDKIHDKLESIIRQPYLASAWPNVCELKEEFLNPLEQEINTKKIRLTLPPDVLNAAWLARIEDWNRSEDIIHRAHAVFAEIEKIQQFGRSTARLNRKEVGSYDV